MWLIGLKQRWGLRVLSYWAVGRQCLSWLISGFRGVAALVVLA